MRNWSRIVLLVGVLVMVSFVNAQAWPPQYGDCYVGCDGSHYWQSYTTSDECCSQNFICPDNNPPYTISWHPYDGWPMLCR